MDKGNNTRADFLLRRLDRQHVGISDEDHGEEVMVCCITKPGSECSEDEVRDFCMEQLGHFKTPKVIKLVDSLPKDSSGTVQRDRIKDIYGS